MIKINVMRTFINRLKDRGWKNIPLRGYTDHDNQVLRRGDINIVGVISINVDATANLIIQIDALFRRLIELLNRAGAKEIFLPGGGDIPVPDFFRDYCRDNGIQIHLISLESFRDYNDYI